jgi:hypothetical protein
MTMIRKSAFAAMMTFGLLLAPQAYAQNVNLFPSAKQMTPEEREQQRKVDEAYRARMSTIPDAQQSNDPWGNVRGQGVKPQSRPSAPPAQQPASRSSSRDKGPLRLH